MKYPTNILPLCGFLFATTLGSAQASIINGSFEDNFNNWTATGDAYLVTDTGSGRSRHDYLTYQGWEGADVWFSGSPKDGGTYAVFGSKGNESDGSLTSALWTADKQFITFWQTGNDTTYNRISGDIFGPIPESERAFAAIYDINGVELGRVVATSYNDNTWHEYTLDLNSLGLHAGDQFRFYYQDGYSWSVIDNVSASGPALQSAVPEPSTLFLLGIGACSIISRCRSRRDV